MTPTQLQTLANHIRANADPDVVAALAIRNDTELARLYNLDSAFIVWRKAIPSMEMGKTVIYNALAAMTTANTSRVSLFMDLNRESFDGSSDLDAYFADTFGGALNGQGANCRAALAAMLRRAATICEQIFATGTGTTQSPGDIVVEGSVTTSEIGQALNEF